MLPPPSPQDRRRRASRAERQIARDLLRESRRSNVLDDALRTLARYIAEHPDATPDEVLAAMGPLVYGAVDRYIEHHWGVLIESLPAMTEDVEG